MKKKLDLKKLKVKSFATDLVRKEKETIAGGELQAEERAKTWGICILTLDCFTIWPAAGSACCTEWLC